MPLDNITVQDDGQSGVSYDPPFCYFENGTLLFNADGTNTGDCSASHLCLCADAYTAQKLFEIIVSVAHRSAVVHLLLLFCIHWRRVVVSFRLEKSSCS